MDGAGSPGQVEIGDRLHVPKVAAGDAVPVTFSLGTAGGSQTLAIPISN